MALDPGEDRRAARELVDTIIGRRTAADDPYLGRMPDDVLGVLMHIAAYRVGPDQVRRQDFADGWALAEYLERELMCLRIALLVLARSGRMTWDQIAAVTGDRSRQAAQNRLRRLQSGAAGQVMSERPARAAAAEEAEIRQASELRGDALAVRAVAAALIRLAELVPADVGAETGIDLDDLREELKALGPGQVSTSLTAYTAVLLRALLHRRDLDGQLVEVVAAGSKRLGVTSRRALH